MEENGLPTVYIGSCRDMMKQVKSPRSVFVNFPLGRACGKPNDSPMQREIVKAALAFLVSAKEPGEMLDLSHDWGKTFEWNDYMKDIQEMLEAEGGEKQAWKPIT
jgi:D-proline reductase (dithiol) PrdB